MKSLRAEAAWDQIRLWGRALSPGQHLLHVGIAKNPPQKLKLTNLGQLKPLKEHLEDTAAQIRQLC